MTITVTGSNDGVVNTTVGGGAAGEIAELADTAGSASLDQASGVISFTDADLKDTHAVVQGAPSFAWSGGTLTAAQITALTSAGALTLAPSDSTGSGSGSVAWTYKIADGALDFLGLGETLSVTTSVTVADGKGGTMTQPITVTATGANDAPVLAPVVTDPLIDFDDSAPTDYSVTPYTFVEDAYRFSGFAHFSNGGYGVGGSGSAFLDPTLDSATGGADGEVRRSDGSAFSLQSFAVAFGQDSVPSAFPLTVRGYSHGTLVATQSVTVTKAYQTLSFDSSWATVDDVTFDAPHTVIAAKGGSYGVGLYIDNLRVGDAGCCCPLKA